MVLGSRDVFFCLLSVMLVAWPGCVTPDPETNGKRARALEGLGVSHLMEGEPNLAVKHLIEAAKADPGDPYIAHSLALAYKDLGLFDRAVAEFQRALNLEPDFPEAVNNMGVTYVSMGMVDDAISCFEKAAGTISYANPNHAFLNLGLAYYQKGDYRRSISYYKEALRIEPSFLTAYENLGLAYEAVGEWEKAREAYQSSISYEPDSPKAYFFLGKLHQKLGRRREAVEMFQKAFNIDPESRYGRQASALLWEHGVIPTESK
jgi:type IV pilus assembly protein PilF